jgi:pyruvyl transferase EpsO
VRSVLDPLLDGRSRCALLDFPNQPNVGDSAIWLGAVAYLRSRGIRVAYRSDAGQYDRELLTAALGDGVILFQGGGNLGDLWPASQQLRERVIDAFPHRRIVLLPQTIYFRRRESLERARKVFDGHPDLTVLVRDHRSLELARNEFRAPSFLCPDMAFLLGSLPRRRAPGPDVLWLWRNDQESAGWAPVGDQVVRQDWLTQPRTVLRLQFGALQRLAIRYPRRLRLLKRVLPWLYDPLARQRLAYGCQVLGRARTVITDRLHGHILSVLLGVPHVLLDNNYGKVRGFYEAWTKESELAVWADSPDEAVEKVKLLQASC